jgi:hypothetical protein
MGKPDTTILAFFVVVLFVSVFGICLKLNELTRLTNEVANIYNRVTEIEKEIHPR